MPPDIDAKLDELIEEIRKDFLAWERFYWDGVEPVEPDDPAERIKATLEWGEPSPEVIEQINLPRLDVSKARQLLQKELKSFMRGKHSALLLRIDAGVGKSTALIKLSQAVASAGHNVLYLMPYHRYWDDIMANPATDPELWYHWQSVNGKTETGDAMCRYEQMAVKWTGKGYPLVELCKRLCLNDNHINRCPYRCQRLNPIKIKAGVHPHLVTGIAIENIHLCVVDELPIGHILTERVIPQRSIQVAEGNTDLKTLLDILKLHAQNARWNERIDGKRLLDSIGGLLGNIYNKINLNAKDALQEIPEVEQPGDVDRAKEWYIFDMLRLLVPEYHAWKNGLESWLTRVYINHEGLHLLQRKLPWRGLPQKMIILDATGKKDIYEKLLNRPVQVLDVTTKREGKVFQITGRLNNVTSVLDKKTGKLRKGGNEAADLIRLIKQSKPLGNGQFGEYERVGIVTFKSIVDSLGDKLESIPGVSSVWYHGSRGTNSLEGVDCLVCLGSPAIPDNQVVDAYAQLHYEPGKPEESAIRPFQAMVLPNGLTRPLRHAGKVEYIHLKDGQSPKRYLSGFWDYPQLQLVADLYQSDELVQAIGRGRIPFLPCHVWLLTSQRTPLVLDGIYDHPNECLNVPIGIDWKHWLAINDKLATVPTVTSEQLAEWTGVSKAWARHWLPIIANAYPGKWQLSSQSSGRGRSSQVLIPA